MKFHYDKGQGVIGIAHSLGGKYFVRTTVRQWLRVARAFYAATYEVGKA